MYDFKILWLFQYIGDALIARNMAMTNFIGLGPPDLVVLEKNYTPPKLLIGAKQSKHSYFHWVWNKHH